MRARKRAAREGQAAYRGQIIKLRREFVPVSPKPAMQSSRAPRVEMITWNCSGLSEELYQEFLCWLPTQKDLAVVLLQETHWGHTSEWRRNGWYFCHSACSQKRQGGLLIAISERATDGATIRWKDPIPGRLMLLRCVMQKQQVDIINLYQHAYSMRSSEQQAKLMSKRLHLWKELDKLLGEIPWRSMLVTAGDFNAVLRPTPGVAGYGIHQGGQQPDVVADRSQLLQILASKGLCSLNTWGRAAYTYKHPQGESQIDYICVRRAAADGVAKSCAPEPSFLAGWRSAGHCMLRAQVRLPWRPWHQHTSGRTAEDKAEPELPESLEQGHLMTPTEECKMLRDYVKELFDGERFELPCLRLFRINLLRSGAWFNLRGLMSPDTKALLVIIKKHANPYVQERLRQHPQYAYRQGASTADPILRGSSHCSSVRKALALCSTDLTSKILAKAQPQLCGGLMLSLDLHKAFDSLAFSEMYLALIETNMPEPLASLIMHIHCKTKLIIRHGGTSMTVAMKRGLRQGCPVAPMIYAAWTCRVCRLVNEALGKNWTSKCLSIYADDKHCFWSLQSENDLRTALQQASQVVHVLGRSGMQVNFSKSAAVLMLRGVKASIMQALVTRIWNGVHCLCLQGENTKRSIYIPLKEELEYLGVVLSYKQFEQATVQARGKRADQIFSTLRPVLRTQSVLSTQQRLRIYRACVSPALYYGIVSIGVTSSVVKQLVSVQAQHLRKLLRVVEKGVTNEQVLERANIDPRHEIQQRALQQLQAVENDQHRDPVLRQLEHRRAKDINGDLSQLCSHKSTGTLIPVPSSLAVPQDCPVCGQTFNGQHNLHMHIQAKHPELNQRAKISFNRRDHALFGLPYCRFCRARVCDWNALAKHVTQGMCLRLKNGFAQAKTLDEIMREVIQEEQAHPPVPPADHIDSTIPVLAIEDLFRVPVHETTNLAAQYRSLMQQCLEVIQDPLQIATVEKPQEGKQWEKPPAYQEFALAGTPLGKAFATTAAQGQARGSSSLKTTGAEGSLCYVNSGIAALLHTYEAAEQGQVISLHQQAFFVRLCGAWSFDNRQKDTAEFIHHVIEEVLDYLIKVVFRFRCSFRPRFTGARKIMTPISVEDSVMLPIFQEGINVRWETFKITAVQDMEQMFFSKYRPRGPPPENPGAEEGEASSHPEDQRGGSWARTDKDGANGKHNGRGKGRNDAAANKRSPARWSSDSTSWQRQSWSGGSQEVQELRQSMQQVQRLLLRHEDDLNIIKADHSFMIFMRVKGACSIVQSVFSAQEEWRTIKSKDPSSLKRPMRVALLCCIFKELGERLTGLKSPEQSEALDSLKTLKWLVPTDNVEDPSWAYLEWNATAQRLEPDGNRAGLGYVKTIAVIQAVLQLVSYERVVTSFHPTRDLVANMTGESVPFKMMLNSRSQEASVLHGYLKELSGCAALQLIGATLRPERPQRSGAAQAIAKQLGWR
ncbi:Pol [Symbiodinium sp. CCMP2456]|nr:Pol [Symbiodinium sp. CCMP2456]